MSREPSKADVVRTSFNPVPMLRDTPVEGVPRLAPVSYLDLENRLEYQREER